MKAPFSTYLASIEECMRDVIARLRAHYDYVSLLATDSEGWRIQIGQRAKSVTNATMTTERGIVIRVARDGLYGEYAFNVFDPTLPEAIAEAARSALDAQLGLLKAAGVQVYETGILPDEPCTLAVSFDTESLPETADQKALIADLSALSDAAMAKDDTLVDCQLVAQSTHISKLFLTEHRNLRQSYVYSEGTILPISVFEGRSVYTHLGISGRQGPELFDGLKDKLDEALEIVADMRRAERIEPGEYELIPTHEVTGLIAHEAFGHGVEMDMFVKGRALGSEYIGKRVGSDLVTMHEGAKCAVDVTSYAFDDEGTLAGDVIEIDHGILKTGICDALSAIRLGTAPTGNGKRQNFEHKVYTRMTNTLFDSGDATLEDMIASVSHGYLLRGMQSGMEDPKHWGIQCIVERGYEIRDGRLTGKVVSPLIMTGYVPDLLGSISMVSKDREVFGNGGCGKGYKEWVKVADGGPCLKTIARLG